MAIEDNSAGPAHPALALGFDKIRFDRLPLHALLAFQRALASRITPEQARSLRDMIQARRVMGERVKSRRELEQEHAARMERKKAAKEQLMAARRAHKGG